MKVELEHPDLQLIAHQISVIFLHLGECSIIREGGDEPLASGDFETAVVCPHGFMIRTVQGGDYQ